MKLDPLANMLAEKEADFKKQYAFARAQVERAPEEDDYWGDNNASLVAAINVARTAAIALDVIVLRLYVEREKV